MKFRKVPFFIFLIASYSLLFTFLGNLRYANFHSNYYDFGLDLNALFNTSLSKNWIIYNNGAREFFLSTHQSYIFYPLGIVYHFLPSPLLLFFLAGFILSLGIIPLYKISMRILQNEKIAFCICIFYLLLPTLQWTTIFDFHPEIIATTCFLFIWQFLLEKKYTCLFLCILLALSCKEDVGLVIGLMGILSFFYTKNRKISSLVCLLGFGFSFFEFFYLILFFNEGHANNYAPYLQRIGYLGSSWHEIILHLLNPKILISSLFYPFQKIFYLFLLFFQLGFVSLLSPLIFIGSTELAMNLLGNDPMHQIYTPYTWALNAIMMISYIYSFKYISDFVRNKYKRDIRYIMLGWTFVCMLVSNLFFSPVVPLLRMSIFNTLYVTSETRKETLQHLVQLIPQHASVDATDHIAAQLSYRANIQIFPQQCSAQYIVYEQYYEFGKQNAAYCMKKVREKYHYIYKENGYFVAKLNSNL